MANLSDIDTLWNNVVVHCSFDNTLKDLKNHTVTTGATYNPTTVKFGWASLYHSSSNFTSITPSSSTDFDFSTGDFTFECWLNPSATVSPQFTKMDFGTLHGAAVAINGTLWVWGTSAIGQLGLGTTAAKASPVQNGTATWIDVACGDDFTLAIRSDGTLWSSGYNTEGQLGLNDTTNRTSLTQVGSDTNWTKVVCGWYHVLAQKADGTLWGWGWNADGQTLTNSANVNVLVPTQVNTDTWISFSGGRYHSHAVRSDGTLWAAGYNTQGQLGTGNTTATTMRTQIGTDTNWSKVSCGGEFTAAIKSDGTLWTWGDNAYYQCGNASLVDVLSPIQIGSATDWASVECGGYTGGALKTNGELWVWGDGADGALGFGNTTSVQTPTRLGTSYWKHVTGSRFGRGGIVLNETSYGWGRNTGYQIGDNSTTNRTAPVTNRISYERFLVGQNTETNKFVIGLRAYNNSVALWTGTFDTSPISLSGAILETAWHHIAVTRESGTLRCYVDGSKTHESTNNFICSATTSLFVGGLTGDTRINLNGYVDELRITKGVARYTANSIIIPTEPFPKNQFAETWSLESSTSVGELNIITTTTFPITTQLDSSVITTDAYSFPLYYGTWDATTNNTIQFYTTDEPGLPEKSLWKTVSGVVMDLGNVPVQRTLRVFDRETGDLITTTWSDPITGAYSVQVPYEVLVNVVLYDDDAGQVENDQIKSVVPC